MIMVTTIEKLMKALEAAQYHLEYCGYGDKWERECAEGLPEQIDEALREAKLTQTIKTKAKVTK